MTVRGPDARGSGAQGSDARAPGPQGGARPRVVVIGAGFGGLAAARALKDAPADVTVVDRRNHHLFQPLLYQVATATLSPADVGAAVRATLRGAANTRVLMDDVTSVDPAARTVTTRRLTLRYDYLVIATGSADDYFGHPEWGRHVLSLKSIEDALAIRRRVLTAFERAEASQDPEERAHLTTIVLVGGGPTGVELAGALAELAKRVIAPDFRNIDPRAARIILIEAKDRLLPGFPGRLQRYARKSLERRGVDVRLSDPVEDIDARGVTAGGERVPAETVIWAAGQKAAAPVADWLGCAPDKGGRVAVGRDLSLPGHSGIYVIGDAAAVPGDDGAPLPGLAAVAAQEGAYVGRAINGRIAGEPVSRPFRFRDFGTMATIGRASAVADFGWLRLTGWIAWMMWGAVHIYMLIGFRNRASVLLNWIWSYLTVRSGARVIVDYRPFRED